MSVIEIVAVCFGVACVWLTIRQNIWCWPTGLVQVVLFIWIFYQAKLYSDVMLHVVYVVLGFYGWWYWLHGGREAKQPPVTRLPSKHLVLWIMLGAAGTAALGGAMARYTDAALPYWDAATTVLSLVAQYLLARKVLENWEFWIVVDVIAVGVYLTKELYLTSGLYAVFLILAVIGLITWMRNLSKPAVEAAAG